MKRLNHIATKENKHLTPLFTIKNLKGKQNAAAVKQTLTELPVNLQHRLLFGPRVSVSYLFLQLNNLQSNTCQSTFTLGSNSKIEQE